MGNAYKPSAVLAFTGYPTDPGKKTSRRGMWVEGLTAAGVPWEDYKPHQPSQFADVVVTWGIREAHLYGTRAFRHLVMECGFLGERVFENFYLGWWGLNGGGQLPGPVISGRGEPHYGALRPAREGRRTHRRVAILGQVHSDSSLFPLSTVPHANAHTKLPLDVVRWYEGVAKLCRLRNMEMAWRGHPSDPIYCNRSRPVDALDANDWPKEQLWEWADVAVAFSSNSLLEAYMAGVDVVPAHPQAMVWPVRSELGFPNRHTMDERRAWLDRVASYQWSREEIASGAAWQYVVQGLHVRANNFALAPESIGE